MPEILRHTNGYPVDRLCPDCATCCIVDTDWRFTCPEGCGTFKWEPDYSAEGDPPRYRDTSTITRVGSTPEGETPR